MDRTDRPAPTPLSIASLVSGLVVCCPIVPQVVAVTLGAMALSRIRAAEAAGGRPIGGRRLAIAGIILGGLGLVFQAFAAERLAISVREAFDRDLREGVGAVLAATDDASSRIAIGSVSASSAVSAADIRDFAETCRRRFGQPDGVSIVSQVPTGDAFRQEVTAAVVFGFRLEGGRRERTGSVTAEIVTGFDRFLPSLRIVEISIGGGPEGDLRLGPSPPGPADSGENVRPAPAPVPAP